MIQQVQFLTPIPMALNLWPHRSLYVFIGGPDLLLSASLPYVLLLPKTYPPILSMYTEHCLPSGKLWGLVLCPQEFMMQRVTLEHQEPVSWASTTPLNYTLSSPKPLKEPGENLTRHNTDYSKQNLDNLWQEYWTNMI